MYEELIQRLENAAGGPEGIKMAHDAAEAIAALQAENAELQRDAEQEHERYIETLGERDGFEARATVLGAALARVEAERDAAIWVLNDAWKMLDPDGPEGGYSKAATNLVAYLIYDKIKDYRHRFSEQTVDCTKRGKSKPPRLRGGNN